MPKPTGQRAQLVAPDASWYVPEAQSEHARDPAAAATVPGAHAAQAVAATVKDWKVPGAHAVQLDCPARPANVPGPHFWHRVPRPSPNVPGSQGSHAALPARDELPGAHVVHTVEPAAAATEPSTHGSHRRDARRSVNVPGLHGTQL